MGGSRALLGRPEEWVELPENATVETLAAALVQRYPPLKERLEILRWAVNHTFVGLAHPLEPDDEVALIPPVAGGASRARVTTEPLDVDATCQQVAGPGVGATVLFVGTVRDHNRGQSVASLTYEAYMPMAEKVLDHHASAISTARPGTDVVVAHRYGTLGIGDVSVVIAAASPHRDDAFGACRDMLEAIKTDVPIWKCEQTADGETWIGMGGG